MRKTGFTMIGLVMFRYSLWHPPSNPSTSLHRLEQGCDQGYQQGETWHCLNSWKVRETRDHGESWGALRALIKRKSGAKFWECKTAQPRVQSCTCARSAHCVDTQLPYHHIVWLSIYKQWTSAPLNQLVLTAVINLSLKARPEWTNHFTKQLEHSCTQSSQTPMHALIDWSSTFQRLKGTQVALLLSAQLTPLLAPAHAAHAPEPQGHKASIVRMSQK